MIYARDAVGIWHAVKDQRTPMLGYCDHAFVAFEVLPEGKTPEQRFVCLGCQGAIQKWQRENAKSAVMTPATERPSSVGAAGERSETSKV